MRFSYNPIEGELSAYVGREEFEFAADGKDYRVFKRKFNGEKLKKFIQEYAVFMKQVFESLMPSENMYDILALSTYKKDYVWKSLLHLEYSKENDSFFENMIGYALFEINKEIEKQNSDTSIEKVISKEDIAKLSLILNLLDFKSLPEPHSKKKKLSKEKQTEKSIKDIEVKLKKFEKTYGFNTEQMLKYYQTDKFPEKKIAEWLKVHEEHNYMLSSKDRQKVLDDFVKKWSGMI